MDLRGIAKHVLPARFHGLAGRAGRRIVRRLDAVSSASTEPAFTALPLPPPTRRRHIALVSDGLQQGGAERQLVNLMLALNDADPQPQLLCLHLGEGQDFFAPELARAGAQFRDALPYVDAIKALTQSVGEAAVSSTVASLSWAPVDIAQKIIRLAAEFTALRPAVVHGWQDSTGLAAAFAASITAAPQIVITTRNVNPSRFAHFRPWMHAAYRRLARESAITFTNNSTSGAQDYEHWLGLEPGTFVVVRNGVAAATDSPALSAARATVRDRQERRRKGAAEAITIGGMFRWQDEKRPLLWLEVAARVARVRAGCRFELYGGGPMEGNMRQAIQRLGLSDRVHLCGTTRESLRAMAGCDLLLLVSTYEGTPNVVLEAGLLGIPVVATRVGGTEEAIVDGITGVLVDDAGDRLAERLATEVLRSLDDPRLSASAFAEGPSFVRRTYGMEQSMTRTLEIYRGAAKRHRHP